MAIGRISRTFASYPLANITVKDSSGAPARLYADAAGAVQLSTLGYTTTDATGAVDFYVQDDRSYILEVWSGTTLLDRLSGIDAISTTGIPFDGLGTVTVGTSRTITAADNGMVLECTATVTLSVPTGLPIGFRCMVLPNGTTSIASLGAVALLNGATTTLTRAAATATNAVLFIIKKASATDSFAVSGS